MVRSHTALYSAALFAIVALFASVVAPSATLSVEKAEVQKVVDLVKAHRNKRVSGVFTTVTFASGTTAAVEKVIVNEGGGFVSLEIEGNVQFGTTTCDASFIDAGVSGVAHAVIFKCPRQTPAMERVTKPEKDAMYDQRIKIALELLSK